MKKRLFTSCNEKWIKTMERVSIDEYGGEVIEINNGVVLPLKRRGGEVKSINGLYDGGVSDEHYKFVAGLERKRNDRKANMTCDQSYVPEYEPEYKDEVVVFGGVIIGHFGHAMLDSSSRLWWVIKHPEYKVVFLRIKKGNENGDKLIGFSGVFDGEYEIIEKPTKFKKIIIPSEISHSLDPSANRKWLEYYDLIKKNVQEKYQAQTYDKIYLTRSQLSYGGGINEEYYEKFYEKRGYKIIAPEQLPIEEQILLVSSAKEIVCSMGTLSHFALFCNNGTKMTILLRMSDEMVLPQLLINEIKEIDWYIVEVTRNFLPTTQSRGVYFFSPTKYFIEYLKENKIEYDDKEVDYENEFKSHIYDYVSLWASNYSEPIIFEKISNKGVLDLLEITNKEFHDKKISRSKYVDIIKQNDPSKVIEENKKLKQKINTMENSRYWKMAKKLKKILNLK